MLWRMYQNRRIWAFKTMLENKTNSSNIYKNLQSTRRNRKISIWSNLWAITFLICRDNFSSKTHVSYHLNMGPLQSHGVSSWFDLCWLPSFPFESYADFKEIDQPNSYPSELPPSFMFWDWKYKKKRWECKGKEKKLWVLLSL